MRVTSRRAAGMGALLAILCVGVAVAAVHGTVHKAKGTAYLLRYACPPKGTCVAVGEAPHNAAAVVVPVVHGKPSGVSDVSNIFQIDGLACPKAHFCLGVSFDYVKQEGALVPITDGVPGSTMLVHGAGYLSSISCPTASTCWALGSDATGNGYPVAVKIKGSDRKSVV